MPSQSQSQRPGPTKEEGKGKLHQMGRQPNPQFQGNNTIPLAQFINSLDKGGYKKVREHFHKNISAAKDFGFATYLRLLCFLAMTAGNAVQQRLELSDVLMEPTTKDLNACYLDHGFDKVRSFRQYYTQGNKPERTEGKWFDAWRWTPAHIMDALRNPRDHDAAAALAGALGSSRTQLSAHMSTSRAQTSVRSRDWDHEPSDASSNIPRSHRIVRHRPSTAQTSPSHHRSHHPRYPPNTAHGSRTARPPVSPYGSSARPYDFPYGPSAHSPNSPYGLTAPPSEYPVPALPTPNPSRHAPPGTYRSDALAAAAVSPYSVPATRTAAAADPTVQIPMCADVEQWMRECNATHPTQIMYFSPKDPRTGQVTVLTRPRGPADEAGFRAGGGPFLGI